MLSQLRQRRSIRKYLPSPVPGETIDRLKEALLRSPSSRGINPWTFVIVDDRRLLEGLAHAKEHGGEFLRGAALAIVVCGDQTKTDVWVEDCSIAAIIAQLAAQAEGLGSCWVQIRNRMHDAEVTAEQHIQKLLKIPVHIRVEAVVSIGYPDEIKRPVPASKLDYGKVRHNGFGAPFTHGAGAS